jgi:hypothetical protein
MPSIRQFHLLLLVIVICCPAPAQALRFRIVNAPPAMLLLSIGSGGSRIDRVSFNVQAADLGTGIPIRGNPPIRIVVANRATPGGSRVAVLTADSSAPLQNGNFAVPFSVIHWTSQDNDIPSGRYNDSSNQFLLSFDNSRQISDQLRFFYDNTGILEAGTYTGRITYTLTMP